MFSSVPLYVVRVACLRKCTSQLHQAVIYGHYVINVSMSDNSKFTQTGMYNFYVFRRCSDVGVNVICVTGCDLGQI